MFTKKMQSALNTHLNGELYSSYLYLSMSAWLQEKGYIGSSHWMSLQVREELFHVNKFYNFIINRGGEIKFSPIGAPASEWKDIVSVFKTALEHEQKISSAINHLMSLAHSEEDHGSAIFLQWFVNEQIEEEANVLDIIRKFELTGNDGSAIYMIDKELGTRALDPLVTAAISGANNGTSAA